MKESLQGMLAMLGISSVYGVFDLLEKYIEGGDHQHRLITCTEEPNG